MEESLINILHDLLFCTHSNKRRDVLHVKENGKYIWNAN